MEDTLLINESAPNTFLTLSLSKHVRKVHVFAYLIAVFASICFLAFFDFSLPFLLPLSLSVPSNQTGAISAQLIIVNQVVVAASAPPLGFISDRLLRAKIYFSAFFVFGFGLIFFVFSQTLVLAAVARAILSFAEGTLTLLTPTFLGELISRRDVGKASGLVGLAAGAQISPLFVH
jgi:MFS family permease